MLQRIGPWDASSELFVVEAVFGESGLHGCSTRLPRRAGGHLFFSVLQVFWERARQDSNLRPAD
jgi:hypothetical protein